MKKYPKMKDSDVEGIGKIPNDWKMRRIKNSELFIFSQGSSVDFSDKGKYAVYGSNGQIGFHNEFNVDDAILIGRVGAYAGSIILIDQKVWCTDNTIIVKFSKKIDRKFLFFSFTNLDFNRFASKTAQPLITQSILASFKFCLPPIEEQKQISQFLEKNISIIIDEISKNKKLIQLLKEKKQNMINYAVTKGLDHSISLKNSGIDGIEKIPEHWNVIPFKHILIQKMDNGIFKKKNEYGKGIRLVNVGDLYQENGLVNEESLERVSVDKDELEKYTVTENEIFFVRSSLKLQGIGKSSIVKNIEEPLVFECHIIRTKPDIEKINPDYLRYLLNSSIIRNHLVAISQTVTMTTIKQDHIKNLKIIQPSMNEQKIIVNYIQRQSEYVDNLILKLKSQMEQFQKLKQSIIGSVITGKIDVREAIA